MSNFEEEKKNFGEEVVKHLLEKTGWTVFKIGYEITCPNIYSIIDNWKQPKPEMERLRSTPDLFVVRKTQNKKDAPFLVEVKFRSLYQNTVKIDNVKRYQKYWPEMLLVLVTNKYPYLLAKKIVELYATKNSVYSLSDFHSLVPFFHHLGGERIALFLEGFEQSVENRKYQKIFKTFERDPGGGLYSSKTKISWNGVLQGKLRWAFWK